MPGTWAGGPEEQPGCPHVPNLNLPTGAYTWELALAGDGYLVHVWRWPASSALGPQPQIISHPQDYKSCSLLSMYEDVTCKITHITLQIGLKIYRIYHMCMEILQECMDECGHSGNSFGMAKFDLKDTCEGRLLRCCGSQSRPQSRKRCKDFYPRRSVGTGWWVQASQTGTQAKMLTSC